MKGYKVTDARRSKRVGVACCTLRELIEKGCKKLSIDCRLVRRVVVHLEDGTVVNDEAYFATLPQNTIFLLCLPGQHAVTMAGLIHDALRKINREYLKAAEKSSEFLTEDLKKKFKVLGDIVAKQENRARRLKSHKQEDPDWFKGVETNATTKEQYMFRKSQDRVRGYFYKSCEELRKAPEYKESFEIKKRIDLTVECFKKKLGSVQYFGSYFDRKALKNNPKFCNIDGNFRCQGAWQKPKCTYNDHGINPYDSREARILFSTWNLDHRIERSRTILPALLVAAEAAATHDDQLNWEYFFELLFTKENLKLVHIVCHDKGAHHLSCNTNEFFK